jgi:hypothetical protein
MALMLSLLLEGPPQQHHISILLAALDEPLQTLVMISVVRLSFGLEQLFPFVLKDELLSWKSGQVRLVLLS